MSYAPGCAPSRYLPTAHTVMSAMEVRVGDVLTEGRIVETVTSKPYPGVGGGVELTFTNSRPVHLMDRQTVIALHLAPRASSLS